MMTESTALNFESIWEPVTNIVFYEPRTIPAAWDMSEILPAVAPNTFKILITKDEQES